jgi:type I restriction enzyme M protein
MAEYVTLQRDFTFGAKSWFLEMADVDKTTFDLSVKNPNAPEAEALRSPEDIINAILARDTETAKILESIRRLL